jgi:hypothetical protein
LLHDDNTHLIRCLRTRSNLLTMNLVSQDGRSRFHSTASAARNLRKVSYYLDIAKYFLQTRPPGP